MKLLIPIPRAALLAGFLATLLLSAGASERSTAFSWKERNDQSIELREGDRPVLVYNHGMISKAGVPERYTRSSYVHPIYGLEGEVLTDDFPKDHYHHRGLFWAWPHVQIGTNHYDLWMVQGIEQRFVRWMEREAKPQSALLAVENGWFVGDRKVMRERVRLLVHPSTESGQAIDVTLEWTPLQEPITLRGAEDKSYGGLTLRYAPRTNTVITTALGNENKDLAMTRLEWADLTAQFADAPRPSGIAVMIRPDHPDFPPMWLTRHYGVLCVGWPGTVSKTLPPGQSVECRYRVWIHRGAAEDSLLRKVYQSFITSPPNRIPKIEVKER